MTHPEWLTVIEGQTPLIISLPHTGAEIPEEMEDRFASPWIARKDTDWYVEILYDFVEELGATVVHTAMSRSVIDVNRDPSGASLYPGLTTTDLCPTETFDGEALYHDGATPDAAEIATRRATWFDPYHAALREQIDRLRTHHKRIVVYDAHSIRSIIPRLFEGTLPHVSIGTNSGASCLLELRNLVETSCRATPFTHVSDGRFKGGWITRHYGQPLLGVNAIQVELACRGYLSEKLGPVGQDEWPPDYSDDWAAPLQDLLKNITASTIEWAART